MKPAFLCMPILFAFAADADAQTKSKPPAWKKTILDTKFRSEGAAIADVNQDGKPDIIAGEVWYEAPDWKMHVIRQDKDFRKGDQNVYSQAFAVFAEDLDSDGFPDVVIVGFPGAPCHWYKNPGKSQEKWKEFVIQNNACNETPIYAELFKGKRALVLGHQKEMCYFLPGSDPTKPWERVSVSGKSADSKKEIPGTHHFAHGLGVGDVNGDGRNDIICAGGWWEQPVQLDGQSWKFHALPLPACADIYATDIDGDGKNDLVCSSAHGVGFWWFQQKPGKEGPTWVKHDFFSAPGAAAKAPADYKFAPQEADLYQAINKARGGQRRAPWRASAPLSELARAKASGKEGAAYPGKLVAEFTAPKEGAVAAFFAKHPQAIHPGYEVGVGHAKVGDAETVTILVGDRGLFALPGQTHALNYVDIDGDGVKDLVTGRRYWAHGPSGDDTPGDPALLYWFKGIKGTNGLTEFIPQPIDDDSGIGTQFAVGDINGDGHPDIAVSNKRVICIILQAPAVAGKQ